MKKFLFLLSMAIVPLFISAQEADQAAIKKVIQEAYVDGLQNHGDLDKTRAGFHPDFNLLILKNNQLSKLPIAKWLTYAESAKKKNPEPPSKDKTVSVEFINIDITGNAAVAKIALYRNKKKIFTDYLSLYKFNEGWRVVSKIYQKH